MPAKMDDEFIDELEPLFDYSRVQPSSLIYLDADDEDDEDAAYLAKKAKRSRSFENEKKENDVKAAPPVVVINDEDDDDTWLPPPPEVSSDAREITEEDSTLKKLRLKKQELVSFAESAKDLLKTVEESAKREICDSLNSSMDGAREKTSEPERATVTVSVQNKIEKRQFRVYMDDNFEKIVKKYAETMKCHQNQIVLSFDGEKIGSSDTPASLGMEEGDMIEVHMKSS